MATKTEKKQIVEEIVGYLKNSDSVYITDYERMNVATINTLRAKFREKDVTYKIYKNTLVQRAMQEVGGYEAAFDLLERQTAFAFSNGNPAVPAKVIREFLKETKDKPKFKAAVIEGAVYDASQLESLSEMKSKEEVIGDIMSLLLSPMSNIISGLQAQGSNIVGAIKTIAEKEQ